MAGRGLPALVAVVMFLVGAGLDRHLYRVMPALVTAKVGGPIALSAGEWLEFAMGTRAYVGGRTFTDLSPRLSLIAAVAAVVLVAAGARAAARRRSAHGLLAAAVVLAGLVAWYAFFATDPWTGRSGHTWNVFKSVKWAYLPVLLLQAAGIARLSRRLGRAGVTVALVLVLSLASVQVPWARGFGLSMRKTLLIDRPLRDAVRIADRFRAMPAGRVVLLGRPANLSPWLAIYTALFVYPRPIALDWEDSTGVPVSSAPAAAAYRADLERLEAPGLVVLATGLEGLSDAPLEPLGGPYLRLLEPDRPQLAQVVEAGGLARELETGRPFFRIGPDRTKLVMIAAQPCTVRIALEPLDPSPLPLQAALQVIPDVVGGVGFRAAIRAAPAQEVVAPPGAPLELDVRLARGQTALAIALRTTPGMADVARIGRVSIRSREPARGEMPRGRGDDTARGGQTSGTVRDQ